MQYGLISVNLRARDGLYNHDVQVIDFSSNPFGSQVTVPRTAKVIVVADMFVEDYVGGAELTTQALVDSADVEVFRLHSRDVTVDLLRQCHDRFWVFGNFAQMNMQLIPTIVGNLRYSVVEYDYKYCAYRSPEKHAAATGRPCDCAQQPHGKAISAFFHGAMGLWWMSQRQKERYLSEFPFLANNDSTVLSSVFDGHTLSSLRALREAKPERSGWIVLGSDSWVKGADDAKAWCEGNGKQHEVVWNLPYPRLLERLSRAEGFVYLPRGGDTCPRMVIEAKLLGCELHVNDNVEHASEAWFATDDLGSIEERLSAAPGIFWEGTKRMMDYRPTISGYVTTYDCVRQRYPFMQCIESMLQFCDEVCVVDGGSTDGTFDRLVATAYPGIALTGLEDLRALTCLGSEPFELPAEYGGIERDPRLRVKVVKRDWMAKRHPVFDGMQKAEARRMCTKEFCWQMDADEVVHEDDGPKAIALCRSMPRGVDVIALPVIEYWGGPDKARVDVQPWKWRLSRNRPNITHGIPVELRRIDADGQPYAAPGTDGCDVIDSATGERIPFVGFYSAEVEAARLKAMAGDPQALSGYERWYDRVVSSLPSVFHYSWYDLPRKMRLYRDYWQNHWNALWDKDASDTAENNMMFGVPWKDVTDEMIEERARLMKERLGGWIWHRPWDGRQRTPHVRCTRAQPKVMSRP